MKKGKIILSVVALLALAGSAFAIISSKRADSNLYTKTTGGCRKVDCSNLNYGLGVCTITVPVYTGTVVSCPNRFISPIFKCPL